MVSQYEDLSIKECLSGDTVEQDDEILEYDYPMVDSLASINSLHSPDRPAIPSGNTEDLPYEVQPLDLHSEDMWNQRRRRGVICVAFLVLVTVIILPSVLISRKQEQDKKAGSPGAGLEKLDDQDKESSNDGECSQPTPYQKIPGYTACSSSSDCSVPGECCLTNYCFCKAPNLFLNEQCVGIEGAKISSLPGSEENDELPSALGRDVIISDPGACDGPTKYNELDTGFRSCKGTGDCETHLGECCVETWCFCKRPDFGINEKCVPDPHPLR